MWISCAEVMRRVMDQIEDRMNTYNPRDPSPFPDDMEQEFNYVARKYIGLMKSKGIEAAPLSVWVRIKGIWPEYNPSDREVGRYVLPRIGHIIGKTQPCVKEDCSV